MKRITKKIISVNTRIRRGYDSLSWLFYTITGSSLISLVLADLGWIAILPATAIPIITIATYYTIGWLHEKHEVKP